MSIVKIICMGYVRTDDTVYVCPADLGTKEVIGNGATHGLCDSCLAESLAMLPSRSVDIKTNR
jgi:hypothetical protein